MMNSRSPEEEIRRILASVDNQTRTEEDVLRLVTMLGGQNDERIMGQLRLALRTGNWEPMKRIVGLKLARIQSGNQAMHPFLDTPSSNGNGELSIGTTILPDGALGDNISLSLEDLATHAIITGPSGRGKTWLLMLLILELENRGVHNWILETETDFIQLVSYSNNIVPLSYRDARINPLEPLPGEGPKFTLSRCMREMRQQWTRDPSLNLFGESVFELYTERNIFEGGEEYPTFAEVEERLKRKRRGLDARRIQYLETILNRLTAINMLMGEVFDCVEGYRFEELVNQSIIWHLGGLPPDLQLFFINTLIATLADYQRMHVSSNLDLVVTLDEAHRFFSPGVAARMDIGEVTLFDAIRSFRKRGLGFILASQSPADFPLAVSANAGTLLAFQAIDGTSAGILANALGLNQDQRSYLSRLPPRICVVRTPDNSCPFLMRVHDLNFSRPVTREMVRGRRQSFLASMKWRPRSSDYTDAKTEATSYPPHGSSERPKQGTAYLLDSPDNYNKGASASKPFENWKDRPKDDSDLLTEDEHRYLIDIAKTPWEPATERDKRLKLSGYMGDALRAKLKRRGMIEQHKIRTGRRGGQITLLEVTKQGWAYLRRIKSGIEPPRGKGSWDHVYLQHAVKKFLDSKHGCEAVIEDASSGKAVDITAEISGEKVAVEILVSGMGKEELNILRDIHAFDRIVVLVQDEGQLSELSKWVETELDEEHKAIVKVSLATEFLNQS
jgi:hypothetical protein